MRSLQQSCLLLPAICVFQLLAATGEPTDFPPQPPVPVLSAEESAKKFLLPEGYQMELVVGEPDIREPVVCVFDGNGRMYVAEMRTYMQDIDGKNERDPISVVSRHESTHGDGKFDKHTAYASKLILPRMVLPLDDRVLINETDTNDIYLYRDTKGDGVSDKKELFLAGGPRGGNLEHQPSGLVWAMDNWIYSAGNAYRLRFKEGQQAIKEPTQGNGGQWGCTQDDYGKPWFSNGGGEIGFLNYQTHILYASVNLPQQQPPNFLEVYPAVPIPDVQGGVSRFRPVEKTLNHFTASCGHTIFRGDRLPEDMRGDAFLPEPVGRLIRRAKIEVKEGITYLHNPYEKDKSEFLRSTDPNFRPVNMTTGPDGCLYIVDMYRGIIQEGNWVKEGSYLRKVVQQYSLDKNTSHGRIWRLTHKDFKPGPQPHMLDETPAQLVEHLEHPNGWWRDTAQKLLVLRGDKSVVPALTQMLRGSKNIFARMHALWTLEGLDSIDKTLVSELLKDADPHIRINAIRVSEALLKKGDPALQAEVKALFKDPDPNVVIQAFLTAKLLNFPDQRMSIQLAMMASTADGVKEIGKHLLTGSGPNMKEFNPEEQKLLKRGDEVFRELCFGCHGFDGRGMPLTTGTAGATQGPPLAGAKLLRGSKESAIYILLNGLAGPVDGKSYDAQMVPMNTNSDEWIAAAVSYIRNDFGNHGSCVTPADVKRIREICKTRATPWTEPELKAMLPQTLSTKDWKVSASHNPKAAPKAIDGDPETRYDTGGEQVPGQWYMVELPEVTTITGVHVDAGKSGNDYPRGYKLELSLDGKKWDKPIAQGKGKYSLLELDFPAVKTKFIRITQTGKQPGTFWSIHELEVIVPVTNAAK